MASAAPQAFPTGVGPILSHSWASTRLGASFAAENSVMGGLEAPVDDVPELIVAARASPLMSSREDGIR